MDVDQEEEESGGDAAAAAAATEGGGDEEPAAATTTTAAGYDWSAYYDDEGRLYYYNSVTDESSWEPPEEGFNPPEEEPPAADGDEDAAAAAGADDEAQQGETPAAFDVEGKGSDEAAAAAAEEEAAAPAGDDDDDDGAAAAAGAGAASTAEWVAYQDDEGREYYYNASTGETQWEKPEGVEVAAAEDLEMAEAEEGEGGAAASAEDVGGMDQDVQPPAGEEPVAMEVEEEAVAVKEEVAEEEEEEEVKIDPAVKRLQDAEKALREPDSVMEPDCLSNVTEVVTGSGGNPQKAITLLIDNYYGETAICGLLGRWLADMRTGTEGGGKAAASASSSAAAAAASATEEVSSSGPSETVANQIREMCQEVVNKIAKQSFSKEAGDGILNLSKSEAAFLEDMMASPRWRRLLIDLYASHKDSAVLVYCLRAISRRGHHREIAKRINQSDHYAVFNAMLLSELAVIGRLAVSAGSDHAAAVGMDEVIQDLRRACSHTSFTYLYSVEMLRHLADKTRRMAAEEAGSNHRISRVLRKWEALVQDLESAMMDPSASASVAGSSPLFRKRRLEVALTVSDLHQNRRKRLRQAARDGQPASYRAIGGDRKESPLEQALLEFLSRHAIGIQISDSIIDPLLPQGLDMEGTAEMTGKLLIKHPLAVRAILGYLYKPGSSRITAPVVKNKCARLVALAVLAAEKSAMEEQESENGEEPTPSDEVALTRMILDGSQLCEQLESMVSFLVTAGPKSSKSGSAGNPGQKLCSMATKCAVVAQGVAMWAREFTRGSEFSGSASYPTLSTSILSLVRIISLDQPFTRRDALDISMSFLGHANSDISYKKMNDIKEQSLRLLLFLLVKGEVASVFGAIAAALKGQGSGLDASLVRYFVGGVVDIARPPVSFAFARAFDGVLRSPRCLDAVRSSYFAEPQRQKLVSLLKSFRDIRAPEGKPLSSEDTALVSSLLAAYKVE